MDLEKQDKSARRKHTLEWKEKRGDTCIDCHEGIAHLLPGAWAKEQEKQDAPGAASAEGKAQ